MADYQLDKVASDVNDTLNGAVVSNEAQNLSEAEKAQARENIGASAVGTEIRPITRFDTLEELEATVTNPKSGDAYLVGTTPPYHLYMWDALRSQWTDMGAMRSEDITARIEQNVPVPVSAWVEDTEVFVDYPYKAEILMAEVTENDFPIVAFAPAEAMSGNFCPVAYTFDGKVEVFAKTVPNGAITIPAITFIVAGSGGGGGKVDEDELEEMLDDVYGGEAV